MTFEEFKFKYDNTDSIVLLEGKRNVKPEDESKLLKLGELLAAKTSHIKFRSGNASGADFYFSQGVTKLDYKRLEVITPYSNHREKNNNAYQTHSLDDINLAAEPDVVYQSKNNKKTENLIDKFVDGDINRFTVKAAYIIRDTIKVIGTQQGIKPVNFAIFYDDLDNPETGGTGHTMNICKQNNVPFVDQRVWFNWLK